MLLHVTVDMCLICIIVQRIRDNFGWNRALCDKSTKFVTVVVYGKLTFLKIGGTLKMP